MSEFLFLSLMLIADPTSCHSLSPPYFYGLVYFITVRPFITPFAHWGRKYSFGIQIWR